MYDLTYLPYGFNEYYSNTNGENSNSSYNDNNNTNDNNNINNNNNNNNRAQEQALRVNYVKFHVDITGESLLCRMCRVENETVSHIVSECKMLAQKEYKKRHGNACRYIHWRICEKHSFQRAQQCYEHTPDGVIENKGYKILWDFTNQCHTKIEARRPDIVFIDKTKKEVKIADVTIPGDVRVNEREVGKFEKYKMLKDEIARMQVMKEVIV